MKMKSRLHLPLFISPTLIARFVAVAAVLLSAHSARAGYLPVPNYSFEVPDIGTNFPYAAPVLEDWQETPQPIWYNPADFDGSPWEDLAGTFYNVANYTNSTTTNTSYIDNCDGVQAAFLFALPEVGIFESLDATYVVGKSYTMTVGLIGGGGGMTNGSTIDLLLYYVDGSGATNIIGDTTVTNTIGNFPDETHFVDFSVSVSNVQATNAWAGKPIGLEIVATPSFSDPEAWGGYWDVDNVRVLEGLYVPNFSFENPSIGTNFPYASPVLDSWSEAAQPAYYNPIDFGGAPWFELMGTFYNWPDPGAGTNSSYITNGNGVQSAFLFALPQVAVFQDYNSIGADATVPTHAFDSIYQPGKSYTMTVAVLGGGGGMAEGSPLELSFYYLVDTTNMDIIASTFITNTAATFPNDQGYADFSVTLPNVNPTDPWAGQHIGIELMAVPDPYDPTAWGGYWDVDNVRLVESTSLNLINPLMTNGAMEFTVVSEPNTVYQILSTTNLALPASQWTSLGTFTNATGTMSFTDTNSLATQRFYTASTAP